MSRLFRSYPHGTICFDPDYLQDLEKFYNQSSTSITTKNMASILLAGGILAFDKIQKKKEKKRQAKQSEFEILRQKNEERMHRLSQSSGSESERDHPPPYSPTEEYRARSTSNSNEREGDAQVQSYSKPNNSATTTTPVPPHARN